MRTILILSVLLTSINLNAQNPFEKYGYEPKIATYSQGQFNEFFDQDTIVQIGSALINTNNFEIVAFVEVDTIYSEATLEPDVVSRWLSPDPLAAKYSSHSPYNFAVNNPIIYLDNDGQENVIYLVNLQAEGAEKVDANQVAALANESFRSMGLNTRVIVVDNPKEFNPGYTDPTDAYAVVGNVNDVRDFISNREGQVFEETYNGSSDKWTGGVTNPERSVNEGRAIAIDVDGAVGGVSRFKAESGESMVAFLLMHGAGHNAGFDHSEDGFGYPEKKNAGNGAMMVSGGGMNSFINGEPKMSGFSGKILNNSALQKLKDFTVPEMNSLYKGEMEKRFGTKRALDNRSVNSKPPSNALDRQ